MNLSNLYLRSTTILWYFMLRHAYFVLSHERIIDWSLGVCIIYISLLNFFSITEFFWKQELMFACMASSNLHQTSIKPSVEQHHYQHTINQPTSLPVTKHFVTSRYAMCACMWYMMHELKGLAMGDHYNIMGVCMQLRMHDKTHYLAILKPWEGILLDYHISSWVG